MKYKEVNRSLTTPQDHEFAGVDLGLLRFNQVRETFSKARKFLLGVEPEIANYSIRKIPEADSRYRWWAVINLPGARGRQSLSSHQYGNGGPAKDDPASMTPPVLILGFGRKQLRTRTRIGLCGPSSEHSGISNGRG
jgi:hypothetical protein